MNTYYKKILKEHKNWLTVLRYSPKTVYSANGTLRIILTHFEDRGIKNLRKVQKDDVQLFISDISNGISERTKKRRSNIHINSYVAELNRLSEYMFNVYKVKLPIDDLEFLKNNPKNKGILTVNEVRRLFEVTKDNKIGLRDRVMLSLYYSCGLRRDEAIHLNLADIDLNKQTIRIRVAKNSKQRVVPITTNTVEIIKSYLKDGRPSLQNQKRKVRKALLLNVKGDRITGCGLSYRLKALLKVTNITKTNVTLHSLRHSIATHLLDEGMELEDISSFLGHSSIESTQVYTHIDYER